VFLEHDHGTEPSVGCALTVGHDRSSFPVHSRLQPRPAYRYDEQVRSPARTATLAGGWKREQIALLPGGLEGEGTFAYNYKQQCQSCSGG